jgi:RNA polymerase sigma-70 factor (ECF subfamily)
MDQYEVLNLLRRVRAGDPQAAAELVRDCEPSLRRQIRMQLTDPRLRRFLDTLDVCQSVLANFFLQIIAGEFDLDSPRQLAGLLETMAHNRILKHVRHQHAARRDVRRLELGDSQVLSGIADPAPSPSQVVADADLLQRALAEFTAEERSLVEQRAAGLSWEAIAAELGQSAEALRKRLARAVQRVAGLLGLEEHARD